MKATVIKRLNKRNYPSAEGNIPLSNPLEPGDIIEVVEEVKGTFHGDTPNDKWFKTDKGYFVWSGGTDHTSMNEKIISSSNLASPNWDQIATLELIEVYIQQNEANLLSNYGADSIMATLKVKEGFHSNIPCIQFLVSKKGLSELTIIPNRIIFGEKIIFTDVLEEPIPEIQSTKIYPGGGIMQRGSSSFGTLGFKAFKDVNGKIISYFVSCFHVLSNNQLRNNIFNITKKSKETEILTSETDNKITIGWVSEGQFDPANSLDISLMEINEKVIGKNNPEFFPKLPLKGITIIKEEHVNEKLKVFGYGATSKKMRLGEIRSVRINRSIKINGTKFLFKDIIPISSISKSGDSGTVIFDDSTGKIVGILFAGGRENSYVIPVSKIIRKFKINPYFKTT